MEIEYQTKDEVRRSSGCLWMIGAALVVGALFAGPARDPNGLLPAWPIRAGLGVFLIVAICVSGTYRRGVMLDFEKQELAIVHQLFWNFTVLTRAIAFKRIAAVECVEQHDPEDGKTLNVYVRFDQRRAAIMTRQLSSEFTAAIDQAQLLAAKLGVEFIMHDSLAEGR